MNRKNLCKNFVILLSSLSLISCSSYKPILDQNDQYLRVGEAQAQIDSDACVKEGDEYLKKYKQERVVKEAARKAVIGTVIGGAFSLVFGNNTKSIVRGLALGAGIGAATGAIGAAGEGTITPDQVKQRYVNNCLNRKGYSVIGWH